MKKAILALLIAFLLPAVSFASFDTNLKYGAQGTFVSELQEFLASHNYLNSPATGNFFSLTLAAVKQFQAANNLPATGYFGPMSRSVANSLLSSDLASSTDESVANGDATTTPVVVAPPVQVQWPTSPPWWYVPPVVQAAPVAPSQPLGAVTPPAPVVPKWRIDPVTPYGKTAQANTGVIRFEVSVYDKNGVYQKQPVTVTTDDPDIPSSFVINRPSGIGSSYFFCVAPPPPGTTIYNGCPAENPVTPGTFNFTFTVDDISTSTQITVTP